MQTNKIRVLVVDDTALYRKIIRDVLSEFEEVEVVGSAPNGKIALSKIDTLQPDLITLDQEMPEMDGMETLRQLRATRHDVATIMVSAHTKQGANLTLKALELGAFDFIAKPDKGDIHQNTESLREQFTPKIQAFSRQHKFKIPAHPFVDTAGKDFSSAVKAVSGKGLTGLPKIVSIGISTGGPKALADVIPQIPANLNVPVVIVQHMPPVFTRALADSLNSKSALTVVEAQDGQVLRPNFVYIAPGGKQMKIVSINGQPQLRVNEDPPENHCRPSVDYLFRSVATMFPGRALGVIMTGMGRDGAIGARLMKRSGAHILAQDEQSCVVFGMPMEAIKAGVVDEVLDLKNIAGKIIKITHGIN